MGFVACLFKRKSREYETYNERRMRVNCALSNCSCCSFSFLFKQTSKIRKTQVNSRRLLLLLCRHHRPRCAARHHTMMLRTVRTLRCACRCSTSRWCRTSRSWAAAYSWRCKCCCRCRRFAECSHCRPARQLVGLLRCAAAAASGCGIVVVRRGRCVAVRWAEKRWGRRRRRGQAGRGDELSHTVRARVVPCDQLTQEPHAVHERASGEALNLAILDHFFLEKKHNKNKHIYFSWTRWK